MANKTLDYSVSITQSPEELSTRIIKARQPLIRRRLRFLHLLKTTPGLSRAAAGKKLGLLSSGAEEVWELYKKSGIDTLIDYPFKGRSSKLSDEQKIWLAEELKKDGTATLAQACAMVEEHTSIHYGITGMHYVFKSLKVKKKTGRPTNVGKDVAGEEAFKKKSSRS